MNIIDFITHAAQNPSLIEELKQLPLDPDALYAFFANHEYNVTIDECNRILQLFINSIGVDRAFIDAY